jgi:flagellar biogenesis protein FliO
MILILGRRLTFWSALYYIRIIAFFFFLAWILIRMAHPHHIDQSYYGSVPQEQSVAPANGQHLNNGVRH